jgi:hypothetical protein
MNKGDMCYFYGSASFPYVIVDRFSHIDNSHATLQIHGVPMYVSETGIHRPLCEKVNQELPEEVTWYIDTEKRKDK